MLEGCVHCKYQTNKMFDIEGVLLFALCPIVLFSSHLTLVFINLSFRHALLSNILTRFCRLDEKIIDRSIFLCQRKKKANLSSRSEILFKVQIQIKSISNSFLRTIDENNIRTFICMAIVVPGLLLLSLSAVKYKHRRYRPEECLALSVGSLLV